MLTGQIQKLDKELSNQKREIAALQRAVTDMQSALVQERKISAKVYAENDKLKIQELENRRKVRSYKHSETCISPNDLKLKCVQTGVGFAGDGRTD